MIAIKQVITLHAIFSTATLGASVNLGLLQRSVNQTFLSQKTFMPS